MPKCPACGWAGNLSRPLRAKFPELSINPPEFAQAPSRQLFELAPPTLGTGWAPSARWPCRFPESFLQVQSLCFPKELGQRTLQPARDARQIHHCQVLPPTLDRPVVRAIDAIRIGKFLLTDLQVFTVAADNVAEAQEQAVWDHTA